MTDYWSTQTGRIYDGLTIDCIANGAIVEGSGVIVYGTTTADQITVATSAAQGDAFGIALKAASATGDSVPVLVYGVFKCSRTNGTTAISQQDFVFNSITATSGCTCVSKPASISTGSMKLFGGSSYVLGIALQDAAADDDTILVLVGKCI